MHRVRKCAAGCALILALAIGLAAQGGWQSPPSAAIDKFKDEAAHDADLMNVLSYLTDVYGPRLTNSPNLREAANYAEKTLRSWNLSNVHEESWGPFGRGWSNELFQANELSPRHFPLIAYPKAWTLGTNGPVTAEVVFAHIANDSDFNAYRGKLRGKFVMTAPLQQLSAHFDAQAHRLTDQELTNLEQPAAVRPPPDEATRARQQAQIQLAQKLQKFLTDEGAAAWLEPSGSDDGTIVVQGGGSRDPKDPPVLLRVALAAEQYNRILRTLQKNVPVTLQINAANKFYDENLNSFNILAEIPGDDRADEVVMLGAHFDSWDGGTGATDNAAGCLTMMEAMRILKASGLPMRRTVRLALWTGEEEGLLGSRAYVTQHFADAQKKILKPERAKLSVYFNMDNGTGQIRGVYLQNNEAVRPVFEKWMEPLRGMGMTTLSPRATGGTDHANFDQAGLPAFQFIQDPIEYDTRTHHTNMDVFDRVQEADIRQMATIVASFAYMAANADELLPRKPSPQ